MLISENELDNWVRGHSAVAQGVIVELVYRLIATSCPRPDECRFPLGDSIGQPGEDGFLVTQLGLPPFVPIGVSYWEIGTGVKPGPKATKDYRELTKATDPGDRRNAAFVFVTPLSGTRGWQRPAQTKWLKARRERAEWNDVRVVDGTGLIAWMQQFPAVGRWLAAKMGFKSHRIATPEQRWAELRQIGDPPPLPAKLLLTSRDAACQMLSDLFDKRSVRLKIDTRFPRQIADFVAAYISTLDGAVRSEITGRCLIVSDADAWNELIVLRDRHILVADFDVDDTESHGIRLLENARGAGHSVIYSGMPGGIPDLGRVYLASPKSHQVEKALHDGGYSEERARNLAQRTGGDLNSLLRCIQGLSLSPEWTQSTDAAELVIAAVLGAWTENCDADRGVVEAISGKGYGEWIGRIREVVLRPDTPLNQRDGNWKFVARYEGWYALGPRLFDEHLDRLRTMAISVLQEKDPQFELPTEELYASRIHGKVIAHSHLLRNGLAESLALLGSHPKALTSCTLGKAEVTAVLAVRAILSDADWSRWASLNHLLPLLAEAAPGEFLDAVEKALNSDPCPFDEVFAQEGDGFMSGTYMSGVLWALETLAWDANYLNRVVICLGELAVRDPGGRWSNRPANSLTTILLPWLPQTCAPVAKRGAAVATLLAELPDIGWKLLVSLLPQSHSTSSGTRRPAWRETIPDDWSKGVTDREYREQIALYSEMAITAAKSNREKLAELIDHIENLPPPAHEQLLAHLGSDAVITMPEADRLGLWTELVDLVTKHRKFSDAGWAMKPEQVDKIAALAERLAPDAPAFRHQRLFSERDFDLYVEKGNYEDQRIELEDRRQKAIEEIAANGGAQAVFAFATAVQSPGRVGIAFGVVAGKEVDGVVLPDLLESEQKPLAQFAGGFVWSRFRIRGWQWVDDIDTSRWTPAQIGQFLSFVPFTPDTWERSKRLLGEDESAYWGKTSANPYEVETSLELAIDQLIQHGRPYAAIRCLQRMLHDKQPFDNGRAVRALLAALKSSESAHSMDAYKIVEVIKALQSDPNTNPDDLFHVEWAYLRLFDQHHDASPKLIERRLANEPGFFCEVVRLVFRSKKEERSTEEPTEETKNIATNAYHLLSEWRTPPGCRADGTYDGDALNIWLYAVKKECSDSGHLEIAMTMVGHALTHVPPDSDGLWIHRAAAAALNAKDAGDMRDGFRTELFNSRGAHCVDPTGKPESELADKYRAQAEAVEVAGYHCLATTLRELADSYEREAERVSLREPFDD